VSDWQPSAEAGTARDRQALDAMAEAILFGLDADRILIAVQDGQAWTVRGAASAVHGSSAAGVDAVEGRPAGLAVEVGVVKGIGPVRLRGLLDPQPGTLIRLIADEADGQTWQLAPAGESAPDLIGSVSVPDAGQTVLLVAERARCGQLEQRIEILLGAAVDAVLAEDRVRRERLRESLTEREDERRRWARELHDETLQQLGALQVLLTSVRSRRGRAAGAGAVADQTYLAMDQAADLVASQIVSLRYLINELRPAALDELGLRPPLEALAERTELLTGMQVEMRVALPYSDGRVSTRLLPDIELAVYRVVQEALTNAARHSNGDRVRVVVREGGGQVRVEVRDNGDGTRRLTGFGIDGMRERAMLAGGRLEVISLQASPIGGSGGGTLVRMIVPARHRRHADRADRGETPQS
jgi:signal transduction histidine kinase